VQQTDSGARPRGKSERREIERLHEPAVTKKTKKKRREGEPSGDLESLSFLQQARVPVLTAAQEIELAKASRGAISRRARIG